jgi:hypothetical protein
MIETKRKHPQQAKLSSLVSAFVDYLPEFLLGIYTNLNKLTQDLILYSSNEKSPIRPVLSLSLCDGSFVESRIT